MEKIHSIDVMVFTVTSNKIRAKLKKLKKR